MIPTIARTCAAVGVDGIFMEVHDNPESSPVDGPTQWPLRNFRSLLEEIVEIAKVSKVNSQLIYKFHIQINYYTIQGKSEFDIDLTPVGEEF